MLKKSTIFPQVASCEHAFCSNCIHEWLSRQSTCPVDRTAITTTNLRSVPRILRNLLSRLNISCDNVQYGCTAILKLDALQSHLEECEHNPKRPLPCEAGCGFVIPKDELHNHNCVKELRTLCLQQQQKISELKQTQADQNISINELKRELNLIKSFIRAMRVNNPGNLKNPKTTSKFFSRLLIFLNFFRSHASYRRSNGTR